MPAMASKDVVNQRRVTRKETGRRILVRLRKLPNLSQAELARRVGIHPSSLSFMIAGKRSVPPEKLPLLARELGCSVADLLPGAPEPPDLAELPPGAAETEGEWPPGLRDFLQRHRDDPRLNDRIRWHLINSRTRLEPWAKADDLFWSEFTDFWVDYLAARESKKH